MADCRIVNESVKNAVVAIGGAEKSLTGIALQYKQAGENLTKALNAAIAPMEGETKDALNEFFTQKVKKFTEEDLPAAIHGMSVLLEANRQNFEDVDKKIAESIKGN